jgi:hypothetical protein
MQRQSGNTNDRLQTTDLSLKVLNSGQIQRIDNMLDEMGPFGELRLIKKKGRVRFIEKVESFDLAQEQ